jgi:hypothetical protein
MELATVLRAAGDFAAKSFWVIVTTSLVAFYPMAIAILDDRFLRQVTPPPESPP